MKLQDLSLFAGVVALVALCPALTGCVEEEYEQEAAYPQAIGYDAASDPARAQRDRRDPAGQAQVAADAPADEYPDADPAALTDFRAALDPYGSWVEDETYGTVWVPSSTVVGSDFAPYVSGGHWAYDSDYTWVSDYSWGWAPFHYGRWVYAGGYGWEWIPGRAYSGAWVSWRHGWGDYGYVGWAPLGPLWCWRGGVAVGLGFVPVMPYGFVPTGALFAPSVAPHMVAGGQVAAVAANTHPYVAASPTVAGASHVGATPRVNGPSPQALHIPATAVVHTSTANQGTAQALAYARPSTATALGARAPQGFTGASPSVSRGQAAYAGSASSHFGGKLGYGFQGGGGGGRTWSSPSSGYSGRSQTWSTGAGGWSHAGGGYHPGTVAQPSSSGHSSGESGSGSEYSPHAHGSYRGGYHGGGFSGGGGVSHGGGGSFGGGGGHSSGGGGHSGGHR